MTSPPARRWPAVGTLAVVALAVIAVAGALGLRRQVQMFLAPALPVVRLWSDPEAQRRLQYSDAPYDLLREAEQALPRTGGVLLVTSGQDVRGAEYRAFHRALYRLAPRPVWWLSPAPSDGTWEARWWISAPVDAATVLATAAAHDAAYVLALNAPHLDLPGELLVQRQEGVLVRLAGPDAPAAPAPALSQENSEGQRLRLVGALLVLWLLGDALVAFAGWLARRGGRPWPGLSGLEAAAVKWIVGSGSASLLMLGLNQVGVGLESQIVAIAALGGGWLVWRTARGLQSRRTAARRQVGSSDAAGTGTLVEPAAPAAATTVGQPELSAQASGGHRFGWRDAARAAAVVCLISLVVLQLTVAGVLAVGQPLAGWDGWTSWGMRARTIFLEGGVTPAVYADPSRASTQPGYPLLTPLLQAWLYGWLGVDDDRLAGVVLWLYYAALVGLVYGAVRRRGAANSRLRPLLAAAAVASIPWLVTLTGFAYVDGALAALAAVAALYLVDWLESGARGALVLAVVAAGLMPWAKQEGLVLAAVLLLAALLVHPPWRSRRGWAAAAAGAAAALTTAGVWRIMAAGSPPSVAYLPLAAETLQENLNRVPEIWRTVRSVLASAEFSFVWPVALLFGLSTLALPAWQRRAVWRSEATLLPLASVLYLAMVSATYLLSAFQPYQQHVLASFFRLASQVVALPVIWLAYCGCLWAYSLPGSKDRP